MLNQVILETRIAKNEGVKFTNKGNPFLNLLMVFHTFEKKENQWSTRDNFIWATLWGKRAQALGEKLKPGHTVIVRGKLGQNQWETENGEKKSVHVLTIEDLHFAKVSKPKFQY